MVKINPVNIYTNAFAERALYYRSYNKVPSGQTLNATSHLVSQSPKV